MVNTVTIKQAQLRDGFLTIGSGSEVILIMGSCRVAPYVNYLKEWNEHNDNKYTIHTIDVFNWNWDLNDNRVDYISTLKELETNERVLSMLKSVDIFIHEYYKNAAMFNCDKEATDGIYSFGMRPKIDICIPSWNDVFVFFGDIVTFDIEMRKMAMQDYNVLGKLSEQTEKAIMEVSQENCRKFGKVCYMSDVPEMANYFLANWLDKRFFWSYNHVSKHFTLAVFKFINEKFLHLDLSKGFDENHVDMFANNFTKLTEYDIKHYNFKWPGEEIIELKSKLF